MSPLVARSKRFATPAENLDSVHELLRDAWSASPDLSAHDRMSVETAVAELVANVIQHTTHGNDVAFTLTVIVEESQVEVTVSDSGDEVGVDVEGRTMPDPLAESGRGLPLMQALLDSVEYDRVEGMNHWTLIRARDDHPAAVPKRSRPSTISISGVIDEMARQRALDELGILDTPVEERFDRVTRLAQQLFRVETVAISMIDRDRQWSKSIVGKGAKELSRAHSVITATIETDETLIVPDLNADPRFAHDADAAVMQFYAGHPLYAPGGERIGAFCIYDSRPRSFGAREAAMLRDLASWVQQELTVSQELSRAAQVQQGLLPRQLLSMPGWEIAGMCLPARAVGGDFYDWYPVGEGAAFTLADTMGKGIGSAIIAATVRAVLRSAARFGDVTGAVEAAAAALIADLDNAGLFVTLFHGRLDMDTGELTYIDAGHGLTIVLRVDGSVERLTSFSPPLGIDAGTEWTPQTVTLERGDTLVAMSDGVLDLYDGSLQSLDNVAALAMLAGSAEEIVQAMRARARGVAPDDVTVMVVRRDP